MGFEGHQLIAVTPNELDRIVTGLRQEVADGFTKLKSHIVEKPLTRIEAAEYLRIGLTAFNNRIRSGAIPKKYLHKNGGTTYFYASELQQLLKTS